ncbi:MAG: hypothetical protein N2508_02705, partial [Anaerolineae bacterium]|nr:hypothetical protein [Anaerolineae bacterium]
MGQETTATATPDTPALISLLSGVIKELSAAKRFSEQLDFLRTRYEDSAEGVGEGYAEMLSALFAAGVGLAISLSASLEEVPDMVAQACKAATERDFDREKRSLKRPQRPYYDAFARHLTAMLNSTSEAIGAVIECYLSGNYDPDANPNDLILEALYSADADLEQARALLAQAGSIALHGSPLWWRWHVEATGPLSLWVIAISELIHGYTHTDKNKLRDITPPLSLVFPLSQIEGAGSISAVLEKRMGRSRPVAELIEALIEQGATDYTEEQLAACEAHRAEVIPALIELATDAYLQWEDSPGEGYAPIKAVEILGRLKATEAITALIDIVADSDPEAIIYSTAINALEEIGPPALEPILDFMRYSWNTWAKIGLGEVVDRIGSEDAEAFQVLVSVWEEADWEDGKCLLAWPLIRTGGEQAIPLLQEALKDPELGELDYGEIAAALRELGVEPPSFEERTPTRSPAEWEAFGYTILSQMTTPSYISAVLADVPPELQAKPEELVHIYTFMQCRMWASMLISTVVLAPAEAQVPLLNGFLDALDAAALPPAPKEFPVWMRKVYNLIPRELDSQIKPYLEGILLPLLHYAEEDYDIAEEPDQLLAQARELPPDDESLSALFGKAGALVLHGRQCWPLWPQESDPPLSIWLEGLLDLSAALKKVGQIPFHPPMEKSRQEELTANILDTVLKGTKDVHTSAPPPVQELLQELVECKQSTLPPARRRAFARHQAALVPYLIELVEDIRYWYKEGPGEGWAAILAIKLLGEFRACLLYTSPSP